ncbi:hypothetical protein COV13_01535 [Candidatus Woesearchaeota archaeon CG10_big_fil_rev_8_21_14_0_10_32_9]|nr:MAG: hypothetical protein COV13_01535 [Candidatus Woesearchaeota archaeon CG10_big_fil_rev_8_21_14_0_10_32_9]
MATLRTVNIKDLELLLRIDKKLHGTQQSTFTPNMSGAPFEVSIDTYTDASMTTREIQGVLKAVEKSDFVFYPINTAMGFAVGFQIANPDTNEALLTFKESQLPRNYDFKRLSEYFMQPKNIERAKSLGISFVNDRSHYDY